MFIKGVYRINLHTKILNRGAYMYFMHLIKFMLTVNNLMTLKNMYSVDSCQPHSVREKILGLATVAKSKPVLLVT